MMMMKSVGVPPPPPPPPIWDVVIVGGGLSGMFLAQELEKTNRGKNRTIHWQLLEAGPVLGGRLANDKDVDMGGAWIWPMFQPHMKSLTRSLELDTFPQPDDVSSTRFVGGAVQLIHKMQSNLPPDRLRTGTAIQTCQWHSNHTGEEDENTTSSSSSSSSFVRLETTRGEMIRSRAVLFAVPPKILSRRVEFQPPLAPAKQRAMEDSQTWMAGVTKVSLLYEQRFWPLTVSNMGLPRRNNSSNKTPAFQVYDASTQDQTTTALTLFTVAPPNVDDEALAHLCAAQLRHVWSTLGHSQWADQVPSTYKAFCVKRWPLEPYVSDNPHPTTIHPHPTPVRPLADTDWNNHLFFAGTETDQESPGVMEGAIGAAKRVLHQYFQSHPLETCVSQEEKDSTATK